MRLLTEMPFSTTFVGVYPYRICLLDKRIPITRRLLSRVASKDGEGKNEATIMRLRKRRTLSDCHLVGCTFRNKTEIPEVDLLSIGCLFTRDITKMTHTSRTRDGLQRLPSVNRSIPSPVISV